MPILSPILFSNNGLPRSGLIAWYDPFRDIQGRNILPVGSENFVTGWTNNGNLNVTTGYEDRDNGNNAVRLQKDICINSWAYWCGTPIKGVDKTNSIWIKNIGVSAVRINNSIDIEPNNTWKKCSLSIASSIDPYVIIAPKVNNDSIDVLVYQPQINIGQLNPYTPPSGLPQQLTDYSGHGNHAQLGSTASAVGDTNDPQWIANSLQIGTDDYAKSTSSVFDDLQQFTCITVFKMPSTLNYNGLYYKGNGNTFRINNNASKLSYARQTSSGYNFVDSTTILTAGTNYVGTIIGNLPATGSDIIWINKNKEVLTRSTNTFTSDASGDLFIGNNSSVVYSLNSDFYQQLWYNCILSDYEYTRAHNYLKCQMLSRGIAI